MKFKLSRNLYVVIGSLIILVSFFQLFSLGNVLKNRIKVDKSENTDIMAQLNYSHTKCEDNGRKFNKSEFDKQLVPDSIKIDKVHVNLPIVSVPMIGGTWKVNEHVANYAEGTSKINGTHGNIGIYAHDRNQEFANIKKLTIGDTFALYSGEYKATYQVTSESIIDPGNVKIFYPTKQATVTLLTCDGEFSNKRYAVRAKLVAIEQINCNEKIS